MPGDNANDTERSGTFDPRRVTLGQIPVTRVRVPQPPSPGRRPMRGRPLGEILVAHGRVPQDQFDAVLGQQAQIGGRIGELLVEQGYVDDRDVIRALSEQTGIPFVSETRVASMPVPSEAIGLLPAEHAERLGALPLSLRGKQLYCALREPRDLAVLDEIKFRAGVPSVCGVFATPGTIRRGQRRFYHGELELQADVWEHVGSVDPVPVPEIPPALLLEDAVPPVATQLRERLIARLLEGRGALGRLPALVRQLAARFGAPAPEVERAAATAEALVLLAVPDGEGYRLPDSAALEELLGDAAAPCRDLFAAAAGEVAASPAAAALASALAFAVPGGGSIPEPAPAAERSAAG